VERRWSQKRMTEEKYVMLENWDEELVVNHEEV